MFYKHSETAGYYGRGGWIVYSYDCFGMMSVTKVFGSEDECIAVGAKREIAK